MTLELYFDFSARGKLIAAARFIPDTFSDYIDLDETTRLHGMSTQNSIIES